MMETRKSMKRPYTSPETAVLRDAALGDVQIAKHLMRESTVECHSWRWLHGVLQTPSMRYFRRPRCRAPRCHIAGAALEGGEDDGSTRRTTGLTVVSRVSGGSAAEIVSSLASSSSLATCKVKASVACSRTR